MKGGSLATAAVFEPYAKALMSIAQSNNVVDQIGQNVTSLLSLLQGSKDLGDFLSNPTIKDDAKKTVLQQVLGEEFHPFTRNFLMILVERRRILFLEGILKQFQSLLRELNQTVLAEVISAVPLTEAQQQQVRNKVTALTGAHQVDLEAKIDRDLIGGVIIRVGSQVIDASLRGQLRRISLRLAGNA
ncbi:MAG: ATP synthase F1 subunit delta [Leptolyngbyaceae cyanobacterium bins.59]|nr:ATP synthase F1 subunit delta [Leptolyngbyaceae cyanobacterium bins.59]